MDMKDLEKKVADQISLQSEIANVVPFGGSVEVQWDPDADATQWGGMAYFADFLRTSELLDRLVEDSPFEYTSHNAPDPRNLIGTMVLAILAGFKRYSHIDRLRNDTACMQLLGMTKIMSDESVRRALKNCSEARLDAWLTQHEQEVFRTLLKFKYIIDIDSSVKPIYGHQEGAELGYNHEKPGRPSHNYHAAFIGELRMVLAVGVQGGKSHSGKCGLQYLWKLIDSLPCDSRPSFIRGDVGYGNELAMSEAERRKIRYLFKIRRSRNVCALFKRLEASPDWKPCGEGWEAVDTKIRLDGWTASRRCLLVRRPAKSKTASKPAQRRRGRPKKNSLVPMQQEFEFVQCCNGRSWDMFALVTNDEEFDPVVLTQLYRDRGDCENNFDEYKNQWGWGGFVTRDLKSTGAMARLIAIIANWWNVFCRLANGEKHMEAITSRPALLGIVGRIVKSGRQKVMHLTSTHVEASSIRGVLNLIGKFLRAISSTAPQLKFNQKWALILMAAFRKYISGRTFYTLSDDTQLLL